MGENQDNGVLMMCNGEVLIPAQDIPALQDSDLPELEPKKRFNYVRDFNYTMTFTMKIKLAKSRKRFVKLLMGRGVSRNTANEIANNFHMFERPWKESHFVCKLWGVL